MQIEGIRPSRYHSQKGNKTMTGQRKHTDESTKRVPLDFVGRHLGEDWAARHRRAVNYPQGSEIGVVLLLKGWDAYANAHGAIYESRIGEDYVLGPEWAKIGGAILSLLNGDLGRLDGGSLDHVIRHNLEAEGFDPEDL